MAEHGFRPDIVLVRPWNPSTAPSGGLVEDSLGLGYLAACLRAENHKVVIIDAFTLGFNNEQIVNGILQFVPRVVGFSLHSFSDYKHFAAISKRLAELMPRIYQVVGGEHATFLAKEILDTNKGLNAVILGEGEFAICDIVRAVMADEIPMNIPGALMRTADGDINYGGDRPPVLDLDVLPFPEKDIVETALILKRPIAISLLTGRGCTNSCTFCTAHKYLRRDSGAIWRRRKPKMVVDELEILINRYYGLPTVHPMIQFQDVIFLGSSKEAGQWTNDFLDELERRNIHVPFYIMARADGLLAHEKILPRLAKYGLSSIEIGIESGVDRILEAYNKRNSVEKIEKAISLLQANNICYDASGFIMFDPHMTLNEIRTNASFLRKLGHATWDRYVTKLQVFPGTELKKSMICEGLLDTNASLDDVYAYKYNDSRVGELARHVYIYCEEVRTLDIKMHKTRAIIAQLERRGQHQNTKNLRQLLESGQEIYYKYFLMLVDLTQNGLLKEEFQRQLTKFLEDINYMGSMFEKEFHKPPVAAAAMSG